MRMFHYKTKTFQEYLVEEESGQEGDDEFKKWKDLFKVEDDTSINALLGLLSVEVDLMEDALESVEQINKIILAVAKPESRYEDYNKFYVSEEDLKNFLGFDDQLVETFKNYASDIFNKQQIVDGMSKKSLLVLNKKEVKQNTKPAKKGETTVQTIDTNTGDNTQDAVPPPNQ